MKRTAYLASFLWCSACSSSVDSSGNPSDTDASGSSDTSSGGGATSDGADGEAPDESDSGPVPDVGDDGPIAPDGHVMEDFDGPDGDPWPSPWVVLGGVIDQELEDGRGRLEGPPHTVARMGMGGVDALDFDVEATVEFTDWMSQGFGLYVRHNGGWLVETDPPGQGYAVYVEGGFQQQIGVWRERDGVEELLGGVHLEAIEPLSPHRVRLQCVQMENATLVRTRIWPAGEAEPDAWAVELIDVTPELQDVFGDVAIDMYNYEGSGSVYVDDFVMRPPV